MQGDQIELASEPRRAPTFKVLTDQPQLQRECLESASPSSILAVCARGMGPDGAILPPSRGDEWLDVVVRGELSNQKFRTGLLNPSHSVDFSQFMGPQERDIVVKRLRLEVGGHMGEEFIVTPWMDIPEGVRTIVLGIDARTLIPPPFKTLKARIDLESPTAPALILLDADGKDDDVRYERG